MATLFEMSEHSHWDFDKVQPKLEKLFCKELNIRRKFTERKDPFVTEMLRRSLSFKFVNEPFEAIFDIDPLFIGEA